MNTKQLLALARSEWSSSYTWYEQAAHQAIQKGWYRFIDSPGDPNIYLARFWLTEPVVKPDGDLDSQNSVLLHYFLRPDSDRSFHDHPSDFTTHILHGGYREQLPPKTWRSTSKVGPVIGGNPVWRRAGDTIKHGAADLHLIDTLRQDTWTIFTMGPRVRVWGFFPFGKPWVDSETYLEQLSREAARG